MNKPVSFHKNSEKPSRRRKKSIGINKEEYFTALFIIIYKEEEKKDRAPSAQDDRISIIRKYCLLKRPQQNSGCLVHVDPCCICKQQWQSC